MLKLERGGDNLGCVFLGESENWFVISDNMDSSLPKNGRSEKGLLNMTTVCPRAPRGKKNKNNKLILTAKTRRKSNISYDWIFTKCLYFGLKQNPLLWFKSYLTDRTQLVSFMGQPSSVRTVTAGVPHGSILGPLLFVMFINGLPLHVHTQVDIFANDTTLLAASPILLM